MSTGIWGLSSTPRDAGDRPSNSDSRSPGLLRRSIPAYARRVRARRATVRVGVCVRACVRFGVLLGKREEVAHGEHGAGVEAVVLRREGGGRQRKHQFAAGCVLARAPVNLKVAGLHPVHAVADVVRELVVAGSRHVHGAKLEVLGDVRRLELRTRVESLQLSVRSCARAVEHTPWSPNP
jgi:hypothetical protein